jgi:hypothetical protein
MQLIPGHEILNKDEESIITLKYTLTEIPTPSWTNVFNRRDYFDNYQMTSIEDSIIIYVKVDLATYYKNDVDYKVGYTVEKTDQEIESDTLKTQIILRQFVPGMIVVHRRDELLYSDNPIYGDPLLSDYEYYVKKISENMQTYQTNP